MMQRKAAKADGYSASHNYDNSSFKETCAHMCTHMNTYAHTYPYIHR